MLDQINLKCGKYDYWIYFNFGLGFIFSMKDIISNRGLNVYFLFINNKFKISDL